MLWLSPVAGTENKNIPILESFRPQVWTVYSVRRIASHLPRFQIRVDQAINAQDNRSWVRITL